ncbi:hypothetical protein ECRM12581_4635 [Escherichia coli O145:H28 str. RM12581]|uniref:Uncharacterized protein n=1 Tax=Escherichia coli O145:H28 (strain RM12581) TaxID=1248823 RepID=A0ABC7ZNT9_ECOLR|nr:hypothetical protein ECRM13514_0944 [Escherichia coli O145:H28 str. RM13514]AHY69457.1 hypothetical protein ECRM12581_4635 [Escherichia coli O145:H28 str. RM12581]
MPDAAWTPYPAYISWMICRSDKTRQRRIRHQHGACVGCGVDALSGLHSA